MQFLHMPLFFFFKRKKISQSLHSVYIPAVSGFDPSSAELREAGIVKYHYYYLKYNIYSYIHIVCSCCFCMMML